MKSYISNEQVRQVAKSLAETVHYSFAWEESLNGDFIDYVVKQFREELKDLNGGN